MPTTKEDIDNFYEFATGQLERGQADWSLEECVLRWRRQRAERLKPTEPFANGRSLRDQLEAAGILGRGNDGPDDLASNPKYMEGFGEQ
jgi:hypothetical protein